MIGREWEELIQDELDDVNTPERSARLRAWLEGHPEGRERMRELQDLFGTLAHVERAAAPDGLRDDVLAAIDAGQAASPRRASWRSSLEGLWMRRPVLRWAYALAAAAVVVVAGYAVIGRGPAGVRHGLPVDGTMVPGMGSVDAGRLEAGGMVLLARVRRSGDEIRLGLEGPSAGEATLAVTYDPAAIALEDVAWAAAPGRVDRAPGRLTLRWSGPPPTPRFRALRAGDAPLALELSAGGATASRVLHTAEDCP